MNYYPGAALNESRDIVGASLGLLAIFFPLRVQQNKIFGVPKASA